MEPATTGTGAERASARVEPARPAPGARVDAEGWGWRHAGRRAWALRGIDLRIAPGERVMLLGASGAGKSTLLQGLAGVLGGEDEGEAAGRMLIDGEQPGAARGRVGLVMQDPEAQVVLTRVGDDVAFGCENLGVAREEIWRRVPAALRAVGLRVPVDFPTSRLSGGQKQRLALATILAMQPGLVLLDEPTANLDPAGVREVRRATEAVLERTGATFVVVEHRVGLWLDLVDRVVVLGRGGVLADGPARRVLREQAEELRADGIWLPGDRIGDRGGPGIGRGERRSPEPGPGSAPARAPSGDAIAWARDLAVGYQEGRPVRTGLGFDVRRGTSTCVVGPNGSGKTTLALTLAGLLPQLSGRVEMAEGVRGGLAGADPHGWRSRELLGRVSMVFQEPEYQFVTATVREELELGPRLAGVPEERRRALVDAYLRRLGLERVAQAHPMTLSGGEKRRLSVATALISAPKVVILDEPTFGQDRTTWLALVRLLREAVDRGTTVVSITHDMDFVAAMGDRVIDLERLGRPGTPSGGGEAREPRPDRRAGAGGGAIRRVNPVMQVLGLVLMTTPLILTIDWPSATVALALEVLALPLVGLRGRRLALRLLPVFAAAPLAGTSMLFYANPAGREYWRAGPIHVTSNSVELAVAIALRVLAIGIPAVVILSRIDPTDMADGLGQVLRLPARPVLAALAGARTTGLMVADWRALRRARRVRGIGDGNAVAAFFRESFALLVFALRRAAKLSLTMEARGFGSKAPRTWARPSSVGPADAVMLAYGAAVPALALWAAFATGLFRLAGR